MNDGRERHTLVHEELPAEHEDPLIRFLHRVIRAAVRLVAVLMVLVILWGAGDVVYVFYLKLSEPPALLMDTGDIFDIFGAFMVVLIAIEIFVNIRLYLGTSVIPIQLVVATALMAIARKVIVLDLADTEAIYVFGIAAVVIALGITYWMVTQSQHGEKKKW